MWRRQKSHAVIDHSPVKYQLEFLSTQSQCLRLTHAPGNWIAVLVDQQALDAIVPAAVGNNHASADHNRVIPAIAIVVSGGRGKNVSRVYIQRRYTAGCLQKLVGQRDGSQINLGGHTLDLIGLIESRRKNIAIGI